jgi:hypothetical protein
VAPGGPPLTTWPPPTDESEDWHPSNEYDCRSDELEQTQAHLDERIKQPQTRLANQAAYPL